MKKKAIVILISIFLVTCFSYQARSTPIELDFFGHVTNISIIGIDGTSSGTIETAAQNLSQYVKTDDIFSVKFIYDTIDPLFHSGIITTTFNNGSFYTQTINVGGHASSTCDQINIFFTHGSYVMGDYESDALAIDGFTLLMNAASGVDLPLFKIGMFDTLSYAMTTDLFFNGEMSIYAECSNDLLSGGHFIINGTIDSIAPVPEPTTILFLSSGLIGLVGFRKRIFKK